METESMKKLAVAAATRMDEKEGASYLGVSVYSMRRWRVYGGGPVYHKIGSRVVYSQADLDEFLAACIRRSTSDPGPKLKAAQKGGQGLQGRKQKAVKESHAAGFSSVVGGEGVRHE